MMVNSCNIPQDEYFEWEDIMDSRSFSYDRDDQSFFPDYRSPSTNHYSYAKKLEQQQQQQPVAPQPISLPAYENFNFDWLSTFDNEADSDSSLPSLTNSDDESPSPSPSLTPPLSPEPQSSPSLPDVPILPPQPSQRARDDTEMTANPAQNVDYLAFPWHLCEADLWASRKHLKLTRKKNNEQEDQTYHRLRNASWRAVAVGRLKLKRVDPRSFNWLKDQDLTWLHGPFISESAMPNSSSSSSSIEAQSSRPKAFTNESSKPGKHSIKPALKQPSLKTLLLRGSTIPIGNLLYTIRMF